MGKLRGAVAAPHPRQSYRRQRDRGLILGEIEELVLLAILRLKDQAYGVAIQELLEIASRKSVNVRGLYTTLQRLEGKGLIREVPQKEPARNTGRARKYYAVEPAGAAALRETENDRRFWAAQRSEVEKVDV